MKLRLLPLALVLCTGIVSSWHVWRGPVRWTPDAAFYQAQSLELRGVGAREARQRVFQGPIGHSFTATRRSNAWVEYSAPRYRRRWLVPALGAALSPLFGERSLLVVSLIGYLLAGFALFGLLRERAGPWTSAAIASGCLLFGPLREWSFHPLTDSWGVAALAAGLWLLARARGSGGNAWLVAWSGAVLAVALTRDVAAILAVAAFSVALHDRTRRSIALVATSVVAAALPLLLFGAPLRQTLAFTFNGNEVPPSDSWSFVASHYWGALHDFLARDAGSVDFNRANVFLVGALLLLLVRPTGRVVALRRIVLAAGVGATFLLLVSEAFFDSELVSAELPRALVLAVPLALLFLPTENAVVRAARVAVPVAVAYVALVPAFDDFRFELVLLPLAALGLAHAVEWSRARTTTGRIVPLDDPARLPVVALATTKRSA